MKGEGLGNGLTVGNSAFICSLHAVTQDTVQGYTFSLDLALSNTSVTKAQLTPSISLAQASLVRATHVSTCLLDISI